jgi:DNA-binding NarL/FixJ family response regulator
VRVVIADDEVLLREGLDRLLTEAGFDVVGKVGTAEELRRKVELVHPDIAIVDIKMPPTHTDEGLVAARDIRASHPEIGVLVLSHYLDSRYAMRLVEYHPGGVGYLLKERVSDLAVLTDALARLHDGECVIDPTIVSRLVDRAGPTRRLEELTAREREVLALIAEGRSNKGIRDRLFLSPKTIEAHVKHIFMKLGIDASSDDHRRVLAVLVFLRSGPIQRQS